MESNVGDWVMMVLGGFLILDGIILYFTGGKLVEIIINAMGKMQEDSDVAMDDDAQNLTRKVILYASIAMLIVGVILVLLGL